MYCVLNHQKKEDKPNRRQKNLTASTRLHGAVAGINWPGVAMSGACFGLFSWPGKAASILQAASHERHDAVPSLRRFH